MVNITYDNDSKFGNSVQVSKQRRTQAALHKRGQQPSKLALQASPDARESGLSQRAFQARETF
jgi:hypothetical protein